jgi:Flp pilus assembly protein TadG
VQEHRRCVLRLKDQRGVTAIVVGLILAMLLSFAALAVDIGYVMVTKNELQNVADAAALAAARQLGGIYEPMSYAEIQSYVCDPSTIIAAAQDVGLKNQAARKNIIINADDVTIGTWDLETKTLTPTLNQPDAVRVVSRRDSKANSPITTFFARIFGRDSVEVWADATAALTGQSTAGPGGLPVPVGISKYWFDNQPAFNFCNQPIRFYPTNDPSSCAGWHIYDRYSNFNDARERDTIADLESGSYESPETTAWETQYRFGGGTMSIHTFAAMKSLFEASLNTDTNGDGVNDAWTAGVPVYEGSDCSNPNEFITIVGFATIVITNVQDSPVHQIDGYVICDSYKSGRGSGGEYGTKGTIPGLVE